MIFVMTSITKKSVIMMVVTAAVYLLNTTFVFIAPAKVSKTKTNKNMADFTYLISRFLSLLFTKNNTKSTNKMYGNDILYNC